MNRPSSSSLPLLAERYLSHLEARGLARGTIAQREISLRTFVAWLLAEGTSDVRRISPQEIAMYRRHLAAYRYCRSKAEAASSAPLTPKSRYDRLATVRHFLAWLVRERVLLVSPFAAISLRHPRHSLPRHVLTEEEVLSLLAAIDAERPVGLRNRAILEVLYGSGLRRAELVALDLADLDLTGGTLLVGKGKGGRSRIVPLGEAAGEAVGRYVCKARLRWLHDGGTSALFLTSTTGRRLSKATINMIVRNVAKAAGLEERVTPHSLRHACATHILRHGADIRHIQELLGHVDIGATEIYAHVAIKDLLKVHARCHPRGRRR